MSNAPSQDRIKEVGDDAGALADYLESTDSGALFDVQIQELSSHLREIRGLTVDGKGLDECEDRAEFCKCLPHALRAAALDARYGTDPLSDGDQGNLRSGLAKP
jgi:hypothetical protein